MFIFSKKNSLFHIVLLSIFIFGLVLCAQNKVYAEDYENVAPSGVTFNYWNYLLAL